MTPAEAARELAVSVDSIYRYVRRGQLPATRLPGGPHAPLRIPRSAIDELLGEAAAAGEAG